jgi:MFS family permease
MASTATSILANDRRPMLALLTANTVSQLGNTFSILAIPWFVLATTGSASQTGITVAVGALPLILVGVFGGAVVDRIGYKRASIASDILSGLSMALIPLLHVTIGIAFWQLLVLVFLGAFFDGPGITARQALYPELVHLAGVSPDRANAGYNTTRRVATVLGQPVAGLLIAATGPSNLLWVNAAAFGISSLVTLLMVPDVPMEHPGAVAGLRGYVQDVRSGFRFLFGNQLLFAMIAAFSLGSLLAEPIYGVILPVYANDVLGSAAQLGFIFAALGAGSIFGNLVYVTIASRMSRSAIFLGGFAIRAIAFSVMIFSPSWWVIALAIFIGAVALEPINPMSMSIMQEQVPSGMRGRVFGAQTAIGAGTFPAGLVIYGFLMSNLGLQPTLVLFVILNLTLAAGLFLIPGLRRIPSPAPVPIASS